MVVFLLFVAIGVVLYFSNLNSYLSLERIQHYAASLRTYVEEQYWFAVILYCTIFIIATIFFLPITIVLTILGGYLFGVVAGLLYALVGATTGAIILFLVVRYIFAQIVRERFSHYLSLFNRELVERGYSYLLMLQLLPVTPTFLINILAGLLPISLWTFAWTTFLGLLPGSLVYAIAGKQLTRIKSVGDILSWPMLVVLCFLAFFALLIPYALRYMGLTKGLQK